MVATIIVNTTIFFHILSFLHIDLLIYFYPIYFVVFIVIIAYFIFLGVQMVLKQIRM